MKCRKTYSKSKNKTWKRKIGLGWFEKYVLNGINYTSLSSWSKYSLSWLIRLFHNLLDQSPPQLTIPEISDDESYLLVDALWFGKRACVMLYRHSKKKIIIHLSFLKREYGSQIAKDLKILKKKYSFTGVVSDGGKGILNAVFNVFGHIPHQICMAHLHRDIINAIGRFPKDEKVKELKRIVLNIKLKCT